MDPLLRFDALAVPHYQTILVHDADVTEVEAGRDDVVGLDDEDR
ncbi:hypothetical protein [Kineosporia corallincola]|nr:hypothetical protein [Kineosporia corallincola]